MDELDPAAEAETQIAAPAGPGNSILASIREQRAKHAEQHTHDVDVPGYGGRLVLRCGPISGRQLTTIRERMDRSTSPDRDFNVNADTLIAACQQVLGRREPSDELEVLTDENGDPLGLDMRLSDLLDLRATSARAILFALFETANSPDIAVGVAAGSYMEWASPANGQINEELLGES